jgi:hypothetical protein
MHAPYGRSRPPALNTRPRVATQLFDVGFMIQAPQRDLLWLTGTQMALLRPFFPKCHGRPRVDDRRVLSGVIFVNRNGLRWCDAPLEHGSPKTLDDGWKWWSGMGSLPGS